MEKESNYDAELAVFKKKLKTLSKHKGRHTELITLYIPFGTDRSTVMNQLNEEINQSSNIKSPTNRKNVQGALRKLIVFLKKIDFKLPPHGIVLFSGNVSEVDGRSDIKLFTIHPLKDLKTKLYWCDSSFHLDPLEEMIVPDSYYAILVIDKNEATIAQLSGKNYSILATFTSQVPGKTRAGGQCVTPDTQIILYDGTIKNIENIKEGEIIKSVNFKTGKTINSKVLKKWQTIKDTITITTKNPKFNISCSPDHKFFVWDNGVIIEKMASELNEESVLLFNENIKIQNSVCELETCFYNSYSITRNGSALITKLRKENNITQKEFAKKLNLTQTEISSIELRKRNPRNNTLSKVCQALNINFDKFVKNNCEKKDIQTLPNKIDLNLAQFLGYFEGDGSFEKERISLFDADNKLLKFYSDLAKNIFNAKTIIKHRENKGHFQARIYGKQIVKFIQNNFSEIKKAGDSTIPKKILNSNDEILLAFLKGLYDAEGYVSNNKIGIGINNKILAQQTQLALLRFGIISSLLKYDNRKNIYSNNMRYTVIISGKYSLEKFKTKINFMSEHKSKNLDLIIKNKSDKDNSRQILAEGNYIKQILLENNNILKDFYVVNMFLNGKRKISKEIFKKQIIDKINKKTKKELKNIYDYSLLPSQILSIKKSNPQPMVDISVESQNFIANGLIVHNSSQRFERLREEAMQDFFKRIGGKFDKYFLEDVKKIKGILIGGPGMTKQYFLDKEAINHELGKKIIGVIDTSYTDEGGVRELVGKSEDLLKDSELIKEKIILDNFLGEIAKDGLATYGFNEVEKAIEEARVATVILSEDIPWIVIKKLCGHCEKEEIEIIKDPENFNESKASCTSCGSKVEILEEVDYIEYMIEKAKTIGANVRVISTETNQGKQFYQGFGGVGALLRY